MSADKTGPSPKQVLTIVALAHWRTGREGNLVATIESGDYAGWSMEIEDEKVTFMDREGNPVADYAADEHYVY